MIVQDAREKSIVISVRLPNKVKIELDRQSDAAGTSLNTLISQVLTKYCEWGIFAKEMDFVSLPRPLVREFLKKIDDKTLSTIANTIGKSIIRDSLIFMQGEISTSSFFKALEAWLDSANIQYRRSEKSGDVNYQIMHKLGQKWNIYFDNAINTMLNDVGYKTADIHMDDNTTSFSVVQAK